MKAYLILQDGTYFKGEMIGKEGETIGELVFTTSMGGYIETLTDPSCYGQIMLQTFPLIGNYGAITADGESKKSYVAGYIVRELCKKGSNFRMEEELNDFLLKQGVTGISGVDTRAITQKIRDGGVQNAMISDNIRDLNAKIAAIKAYKIKDAAAATSSSQITTSGEGTPVVLWNFGAKLNIERELVKRGCKVITVPHSTKAKDIIALNPRGVVLSNGAGNPSDSVQIIEQLRELITDYKLPVFGICMGHQLLALAAGGQTKKMKSGHRGGNQPVKDLATGRIYITSQNHGYAVVPSSLPANVRETMINANDKTCEATEFVDKPIFSVQFHPEACCGPQDTTFLFDKFINNLK